MSASSGSGGDTGIESGASGGPSSIAGDDDAVANPLSRGHSASLTEDALTVELAIGAPADATGSPSPVEPEPGTVLGCRYLLQQLIGRGGTSTVYRARDLRPAPCADGTTCLVAVKLSRDTPRTEPLAPARLQREFHTMRRLSHAGIARVFELDRDGNLWFMSMQLIAGQTLKTWMLQGGTHAQALRIIDSCCEALEYAHSMGIVHGDLKPTNVLVSDEGTAKLIDFGSSSIPGSPADQGADPTAAATPLYASPQVLAGQRAEPLDDVFSLACLSYSILSGGRHPYGGHPSFEGFRAKSAPTYVRAIPPELFEVIERGLSAERGRRPASVREFRRELIEAEQRRRARVSLPPPAPIVVQKRPARAAMLASAVGRVVPGIALFGKNLSRRCGLARVKPRVVPLAVLLMAMAGAAALFASAESVRSRHAETDRLPSASLESAPGRAIALHALVPAAAAATTAPAPSPTSLAAPAPAPSEKSLPLPHDASSISFDTALVHASAQQSMVAITVRRAPGSRNPGAFVWRVERGSAVPTIDYQRIKPRRANFIEGQTVRTLFIPLLRHASHVPHGPRFFDVVLQPVAGGPALGPLARITVVIDPTPAVWVASSEPRSAALR